MDNLFLKIGKKYVIAYLWSSIIKFKDCRIASIKFLRNSIDKM